MRHPRPVALLTAAIASQGSARGVAGRCPHDNLLRCFIRSPTLAITFCSWTAGIYPTASTIYATTTWTPPPELTATTPTPIPTDVPPLPGDVTVTFTQTETVTTTPISDSTVTITTEPDPLVVPSEASVSGSSALAEPVTASFSSKPASTITPTWDVPLSDPPQADGSQQPTGPITTQPPAALHALTKPQTSLACLDDLEPDATDITSACSCFSRSYSIEPVTSTITAFPGPTCPGGQPTFPNCFDDFHPYNCGTDQYGIVACSCALTTEDTAECTLGDYERDNACTTSDDCSDGWYCTVIDCFDEDISSVCTKACPELFNVNAAGMGRFMIEAPAHNLSVIVHGKS